MGFNGEFYSMTLSGEKMRKQLFLKVNLEVIATDRVVLWHLCF